MLFKNKKQTQKDLTAIDVEMSIIAFISNRYVNETFKLSVPKGCSIKDLPKAANKQGEIKKDVYRFIRNLTPPLVLLVNGDHISNIKTEDRPLTDGDKITAYTPLIGG
ncbi:MAG: MoaD/ThiS family protein [Proteobacteria bacterium]|nr:MoaD/ThiS family protein [Pseudomonadota bacterium]